MHYLVLASDRGSIVLNPLDSLTGIYQMNQYTFRQDHMSMFSHSHRLKHAQRMTHHSLLDPRCAQMTLTPTDQIG